MDYFSFFYSKSLTILIFPWQHLKNIYYHYEGVTNRGIELTMTGWEPGVFAKSAIPGQQFYGNLVCKIINLTILNEVL